MKTNPYKGCEFNQLSYNIPDDRCMYSLNLVSQSDGFLKRRSSIVYTYHANIAEGNTIISCSSMCFLQANAVAYIIQRPDKSLYLLIKIIYGEEKINEVINVDIDEVIMTGAEDLFFYTFRHLELKIISVEFKGDETGIIISSPYIKSKNVYVFSYDKNGVIINRKISTANMFSSNVVVDFIVPGNNKNVIFCLNINGVLQKLNIVYDTNNSVTSFNTPQLLLIDRKFGTPTCLIELSSTLLVGTTHNILKITSASSGSPSTISYGINVVVFGAGIESNNSWILTNQNTLFCYGNKRFHNFPIETLDGNLESIFIKNQPEYQFSVQELEIIANLPYFKSMRMFNSNVYGHIEIIFGSYIKNNFTMMKNVLSSNTNMYEYFTSTKSGISNKCYSILFDPSNNAIYPIDRAETIICSVERGVGRYVASDPIFGFPNYMFRWYKKISPAVGIHNDLTSLNTEYYDTLHVPLENITYVNKDGGIAYGFFSGSMDIFLCSIDTVTIFAQIKEAKEDVVYKSGDVNREQKQYPIVFMSKTVDNEMGEDVRANFIFGFKNYDGLTCKITPRATYCLGYHNAEESTAISLSKFDFSVDKMNLEKSSIRDCTPMVSRYGYCAGLLFVTRSICVDVISGLSLSDKSKTAGKPSHV